MRAHKNGTVAYSPGTNGPSVVCADGSIMWENAKGELHRTAGPACYAPGYLALFYLKGLFVPGDKFYRTLV
mgnify:CR=1 FL=1